MNTKPAQFLKKHIFPILLIVTALTLAIQNYTPKTYLSGWDTLHPEFNYRIYLARIIDGVWQEHQGLGAVASQAHPAEIPRVLTLMLFDLLLPTSMVRYAYAFLMLILGPLGVYYFMKKGVFANHEASTKTDLASFLAGLFYLLNLVTLQHFYVPLEMFLTHYGYLGFFMLALLNALKSANTKNLAFFALITFLMAPQAHTSTLFFSLIIFISAYIAFYWALNKFSLQILKNALKIALLLFTVNAFWLLPNLYFIKNHGAEVQESKIQRLFNEEAFLQNNSFGNIQNLSIGKGFLFNWGEHDGNLGYKTLLDEWRSYQRKDYVPIIGYSLFAMAVLGIFASIKHKNKEALSTLGILLISMFFLFGTNPPTGFIYDLIGDNLKLFRDAFRFNFTKFSISLVFSYAVFFGIFVLFVQNVFARLMRTTKYLFLVQSFVASVFSILLIIWMLPAFKGNLISPSMRVQIPPQYFEMFKFFDEQKGFGRVADLPINSFWGWVYYDWPNQQYSYQGAGFLWFGIKQPLMNREFDRWNPINQNYYNQMTRAIYSQDPGVLLETLNKYKIRYIVHDTSVVAPGHNTKVLFTDEIKTLFSSNNNFDLIRTFGDNLFVYEFLPARDFELTQTPPATDLLLEDPRALKNNIELSSEELDTKYISSDEDSVTFKLESSIKPRFETFRVPYQISYTLVDTTLNLQFTPVLSSTQDLKFSQSIELSQEELEKDLTLRIGDNYFSIDPKVSQAPLGNLFLNDTGNQMYLYKSEPVDINIDKFANNLELCSDEEEFSSFEYSQTQDGLLIKSRNADACVSAKLNDLAQLSVSDGFKLKVMGNFNDLPCVYTPQGGLCENFPETKEVSFFQGNATQEEIILRLYSRSFGSTETKESLYAAIQISPLQYVTAQSISPPVDVDSATYTLLDFKKMPFFGGNINDLTAKTRYCKTGEIYNPYVGDVNSHTYITNDEEICTSIEFPYIPHNDAYVLEVQSKYVSGMPLRFCLTNEFTKRCDKYIELAKSSTPITQYFLIPPGNNTKGYTFNISTLSFGGVKSENVLYYAALTPVSYRLIADAPIIPIETTDLQKVIVYNQAYEKNWLLMCGLRPCKGEHVLVNGWANGWIVDLNLDPKETNVLFWPQLFEYSGFVLLFVIGVFFTKTLLINAKVAPAEKTPHN